MTGLLERVATAFDRLGLVDGRALLAVSGGPDSLALLDLASRLAPSRNLELVVAHFDHGIHPDSAAVAARCRAAAGRYRFPFITGREDLGPDASETTARAARLDWLERARTEHQARWIVTAHHRDDQVETVLMRFLRGSGPAGLVGIAERRGPWIRPLLALTRDELQAYLAGTGLVPWVDPSNQDSRHLRGWLRSAVLPLLEARLPDLRSSLLGGRAQAADDRLAWDELLNQLPGVDFRLESHGASVAAAPLHGYSSAVLRALVRALGHRLGVRVGKRQVERVQALLAHGTTGQRVDLSGGAVAALEFDRLRLLRPVGHPTMYRASLSKDVASLDAGGWRFAMRRESGPRRIPRDGLSTWISDSAEIAIRPWHAGDRIRPIRGRGARLVVRCMQDQRVSRHSRPGWPVLVRNTEVIWVPGVCRSDALVPEPGVEAVRIDASPRA